jgi:exodeoxyribonuclease-5
MGGQITENTLSPEQRAVFEQICSWYEGAPQPGLGQKNEMLLTLGGLAGAGKSTLLAVLARHYSHDDIAFCAYTGKAASVLRMKFHEAGLPPGLHDVSTVHKLMYRPIVDKETGSVTSWMRRSSLEYSLIVVDEASMLDKKLFDDLSEYGIPILAVGDHGQLPPVFGDFNLMERPQLRLETIHRQAADSPILSLSAFVRRTGQVPRDAHDGREVQVLDLALTNDVIQAVFSDTSVSLPDVGILTFTNRERVALNALARKARWPSAPPGVPVVGDQVICLKNYNGTIYNGMRGTITSLLSKYETVHHLYGTVLFEDDEIEVEGPICKAQFGQENTIRDFDSYYALTEHRIRHWDSMGLLLDWGFALTVHKSQGSAFEHVIVLNDPPRHMAFDMKKRAVYTAVTRCSKYLVVLQ